MIKELFKTTNSYWLFFILTIALSYGFFLTNSSMGIDDELLELYGSLISMVSQGRIGRIFQWVIGYEYIPFFYDFIAIFLYALGITAVSSCFTKFIEGFTNKQALIFSTLAVSFPFTAFLFAFIAITVHIGLAFLLSSLGTYFCCKYIFDEKNKKYLIFSCLCLIVSISLYETSIIYFFMSMLFIIFLNNKNTLKSVVFSILTALSSIFAYSLILKLFKVMLGIKHNRINEFLRYDFSSFSSSLFTLINHLYENYKSTITNDFGSFMIMISVILFLFIVLFMLIKHKNYITFIIGLILIFLPLTVFFITGNSDLYYRVYAPFGYLIAMTFSIMFKLFENKKIISTIITSLIVLIVLNQAKEINRIFYTENLKFQEDLSFAKFIMHDLGVKQLENKPVVFVGKKDEIRLKYNYDVEAPEITVSIFNWDKYNNRESEFFVSRGYHFMQHQGLKIIQFDDFSQENIKKIKKEISQMTKYPNNGYIKDMGDFVIVKIGNSIFD